MIIHPCAVLFLYLRKLFLLNFCWQSPLFKKKTRKKQKNCMVRHQFLSLIQFFCPKTHIKPVRKFKIYKLSRIVSNSLLEFFIHLSIFKFSCFLNNSTKLKNNKNKSLNQFKFIFKTPYKIRMRKICLISLQVSSTRT